MTSMHHFYTLFSNFWWNFLQNIMFKNNMVSTGFSKIDYPIITHYPLIPNSKSLLNKIGRIFPYYRHPQKGFKNQMVIFRNVITPKKVCGIKWGFSKMSSTPKRFAESNVVFRNVNTLKKFASPSSQMVISHHHLHELRIGW